MDITRHLTLVGVLQRNMPTETASGAWADAFVPVKQRVRCRISQPAKQRAVIGGQAVADLNPVVLFDPGQDIRDADRITITGGTPEQLVGSTWDLYSPVTPSVAAYVSATGRRIATAAG
jgi:hypothetical protein